MEDNYNIEYLFNHVSMEEYRFAAENKLQYQDEELFTNFGDILTIYIDLRVSRLHDNELVLVPANVLGCVAKAGVSRHGGSERLW